MSAADTVSAKADVRVAHVNAATATGRSQSTVRESLGIPLLPTDAEQAAAK